MKTCTDCSSTIPSETEFGWWGTEVEPVVEFVLLPRIVIVLTYTVMGAEPTLGNVTVPDVFCSLGVVGVIAPIIARVHLHTDECVAEQLLSFHCLGYACASGKNSPQ